MDDVQGWIGWCLFIASIIAIIVMSNKRKITKADITELLDAFLATEAVKNLEDKAWKEIRNVVQEKLGDSPIWPIFKKWFDTDTTDEPTTEVKADKPKKIKDKPKTYDDKKKTVELKDDDEEKSAKKDEEE